MRRTTLKLVRWKNRDSNNGSGGGKTFGRSQALFRERRRGERKRRSASRSAFIWKRRTAAICLCTTCPRTYAELEPPADMSWELFTSIVDQIPRLHRAVLHGVGEPMLVKNLPRMVRYLKDRGTYVLFNTNGTVLNERNGRALIAAELDELRVSFDAATAKSYLAVRGKNYFNRILKNVRAFRELQEREGHDQAARLGLAHRACAKPSRNCRISCASPPRPASRKCICSGWCFSTTTPSARRGPTRRSTSSCPREEAVHIDRAARARRIARRHLQRLGRRRRAGHESQAQTTTARRGRCAGGRGR